MMERSVVTKPESEPSVDLGVERLLSLLWLFRLENITASDGDIEDCGYPDFRVHNSAGAKNFLNDRDRLAALGIRVEKRPAGWTAVEIDDGLNALLSADDRALLAEAELLVGSFSESTQRVPAPSTVPVIRGALVDQYPIEFVYADKDRRVEPLRLTANRYARWYLHAVDTDGGELKSFRVDRIEGDVIVDRTARFERSGTAEPTYADVHPTMWPIDDPVEAVVRFAHEPLPEWMAMLGPGRVSEPVHGDDGTVDARWMVRNHDAFARRVVAIGPSAQLVGPSSLVSALTEIIRAHMTSENC